MKTMALTINFTGENKPSTDEVAYFPTIKQILTSSLSKNYTSEGIFSLPHAVTVDATRRIYLNGDPGAEFIGYFHSEAHFQQSVNWNFGSGGDSIYICITFTRMDFGIASGETPSASGRAMTNSLCVKNLDNG